LVHPVGASSERNSVQDLNDHEFLTAIEDGSLPSAEFNHKGHLRLTWLMLRCHGFKKGAMAARNGIRKFAADKGALAKYHETITQFWLQIVYHAIQTRPNISDFNEFLDAFPFLSNTALFTKHWRQVTIQSIAARANWVEPDLAPLPRQSSDV